MGRQKDGARRVLEAFFCVTCHKSTRKPTFMVKVANQWPFKGRKSSK